MSKKIYTTLYIYMMSKKYTLSDNMCLVHITVSDRRGNPRVSAHLLVAARP